MEKQTERGSCLRTMLVPVDGSSAAEAALPIARRLAAAFGAQIVLFRAALAQTLPGLPPESPDEAISAAERYLMTLEAALRAEGIDLRSVVGYGPAADSIIDNVDLQQADLLIMSAHGRSGGNRWPQGSVASKVIGGTIAPTLIVPAEDRSPSAGEILLPLDGGELGATVLPSVAALAKQLGLSVVLLAVVQPDLLGRGAWPVERSARALADLGIVTRVEVRRGDPSREVVERGNSDDVALAVVFARASAEAGGWLDRTVADRVLAEARRPILLIREIAGASAVYQDVRSVGGRRCHNCGREVYRRVLSTSDRCPRCGFLLRTCGNCADYDGIVCQMQNPWTRDLVGTSCRDFEFRVSRAFATPAN